MPKVFFCAAGLVASNVADIVIEPIRWVLPVRVVVEVECRSLPEQSPISKMCARKLNSRLRYRNERTWPTDTRDRESSSLRFEAALGTTPDYTLASKLSPPRLDSPGWRAS